MIMSYGQDDRVQRLLKAPDVKEVKKTASCSILQTKKKSAGWEATGMESRFFENTIAGITWPYGKKLEGDRRHYAEPLKIQNAFLMSMRLMIRCMQMRTRDEKRILCRMRHGIRVYRVKRKIRSMMLMQNTLLRSGKIMDDAKFVFSWLNWAVSIYRRRRNDRIHSGTFYGMDVIDRGVAVLNMHAPLGNYQQSRRLRNKTRV